MSKKRRLRQRIKKSRKKDARLQGKDCHHIFFQKRYWKGGLKGELRMHWYCRVYIPRDTLHRELHSLIMTIPVPRYCSIRSATEQLKMLEKYGAIKNTDPIDKRLRVFIALFECIEDPTADALKAQLEIVDRFQPSK